MLIKFSQADWPKELVISNQYSTFYDKFIRRLEIFEMFWDGQPGSIKDVQHRIEPEKADNSQFYSASYCAEPKVRELDKQEKYLVLAMDVIESLQTEWTSWMVFVPKKDAAIHFCIAYCKLNAMRIQYPYSFPDMDDYIDSLHKTTIFSRLDDNRNNFQL